MEAKKLNNIHYQSGDVLIVHNPNTGIIYQKNTLERDNRISVEDFGAMPKQKLKSHVFNEKVNAFFKDVKDEWKYNYDWYRKMPNFELVKKPHPAGWSWPIIEVSNYDMKEIPWYEGQGDARGYLVYHQGHVYNFEPYANSWPSGQLYSLRDGSFIKWTIITTVAPIFNIDKGKIA